MTPACLKRAFHSAGRFFVWNEFVDGSQPMWQWCWNPVGPEISICFSGSFFFLLKNPPPDDFSFFSSFFAAALDWELLLLPL